MTQTEMMLLGGVGTLWLTATGWILVTLINIKTEIAGLKVYVADALQLKPQVKANSVEIIRMQERQHKQGKDIDALHVSKREILKKIGGSNHG